MKLNFRLIKLYLFFLLFLTGAWFIYNTNLTSAQTLTSPELGLTPEVGTSLGLSNSDIRVTIAKIIRSALSFLGVLALLLTLYGGF
ncbi:MAG: hypothetical protein WCT43_04590, partial [Candidatus Magasanikbacteria bacterium]